MAHLSINFKSEALHMPVMVDVIMPQGHGGYKTLYLLHGAGGDHTTWCSRSRVEDYADNRNIAVIMPSGNNKFYVNNEHGKDYFTFITDELPNVCERWFDLSRAAQDRYIAGVSMGGYGALYGAMKKPGFYASAFGMSPYLSAGEALKDYENGKCKGIGEDLYSVFGNSTSYAQKFYDLCDLVHNLGENSGNCVDNSTKFIISCGLQDNIVSPQICGKLADCMKNYGYNAEFISEAGSHDWDYWDTCIQRAVDIIDRDGIGGGYGGH